MAEHLKRRRIQLGLSQREAAKVLGVHPLRLLTWEHGQAPTVRNIAKIVRFLGYTPWPPPATLGEKLRQARWILGLTEQEFARAIGADEWSLWRWSKGVRRPRKATLQRLERCLRTLLDRDAGLSGAEH